MNWSNRKSSTASDEVFLLVPESDVAEFQQLGPPSLLCLAELSGSHGKEEGSYDQVGGMFVNESHAWSKF